MGQGTWASGRWQVTEGKVDEFVERWKEWLGWTSESVAGFRSATLLRSQDDPLRFTSVSEWDDDASVKDWKTSADFQQKMGAVRALCDDFVGGDFDVAASFSAG
jgi:heme-degrading monooxygenase HmoA